MKRKKDENMRIHADGDKYFEAAVLNKWYRQTPDSRTTVIHLSPAAFLTLAKSLVVPGAKKLDRTQTLFKNGIKFNEIPYFRCETLENGDLQVVAHEGRHRAMNLRDAGVKLMPLLIISEHKTAQKPSAKARPYRWGLTNFRPQKIHGQTSGVVSMPDAETFEPGKAER
jgi:hypothetical protein